MKRNTLVAGALIAAPLLLTACGNAPAAIQTEAAVSVVYPPMPEDPESLLECDKGAPVISADPDYGATIGDEKPNDFMDVARAYAGFGLRPEFGTRFEVAGMNEEGNSAVLTLTTAETVKDSVTQGNVAAVLTFGATDGGLWSVTSSAACSRYVGGDK